MLTRFGFSAVLALLLALPALAQEPPLPPDTPPGPQTYWQTEPRALPFVHPLFSNDMMLQRDVPDPIWGWSKPGDKISVTVENPAGDALGKGAKAAAVAGADGKWMTKVGPFAAGGPLSLTVKGGAQQVTLTNVMVGDIWLCSGQSNMGIPVRTAQNAEEEIKNANYPGIRSFNVGYYPSYVPVRVPLPAAWETCTPQHAREFSALGYYFAREIHKIENIPVGIIHSSVGATTAEVWLSKDALQKYLPNEFHKHFAQLAEHVTEAGPDYDYFKAVEKWAATVDPQSARQHYTSDPHLNTDDWQDITVPKAWQDAGLTNFNGLVWFRRTVVLPETFAGKPLLLAPSQVNDIDITWFNGTLVGCTQSKGSYRSYHVAGELVKAGTNLLTMAILCTNGPGGFAGNPANPMVVRSTADPKPVFLNGTWQVKPAVAVKDLAVPFPHPMLGYYKTITGMYNGMIAPLEPFAIKGALWYQGEASWPFWRQYRRLLPALMRDWRDRFQVGDFPFLIVSLSTQGYSQADPVENGYGEIRESQWYVARTVTNAGLAVAVDIGDEPPNIHPKNKQELGRRLALVARKLVYGEKDLLDSGPEFVKMVIEPKKPGPTPAAAGAEQPAAQQNQARLYFKYLGGGLMFKPADAKRTGFVIAGKEHKFVWADAVIDGDTVVVSSPEVPEPVAVRYGWAYSPVVTLFNKAGLPAIPFRTDQ